MQIGTTYPSNEIPPKMTTLSLPKLTPLFPSLLQECTGCVREAETRRETAARARAEQSRFQLAVTYELSALYTLKMAALSLSPTKPHHFPEYILFTCLQNQSKTTCPHTAYRNVKIRAPNNREDIQHVVLLSCHESVLPPQTHFFRPDTTSQLDLSSNFQLQTISAQPASALHSSSSSGRVFWPLEQCTDSQISEACIY